MGKGDAVADTVGYVIACESTGYLHARSVSNWVEDLGVVHTGLDWVLRNTPPPRARQSGGRGAQGVRHERDRNARSL